MTDTQAGLTEPVVREIIAAFEAPQEGHELAQKLERVWPIIKRALLASVSQPQAELLARAARVYEVITSFGWDISWKHDKPIPDDAWPIDIIAAALQSEREAAAAVARRSAIEECAQLAEGCASTLGQPTALMIRDAIVKLASPTSQEP